MVEETLEREKAGRKFEPTGPVVEAPPPGADETVPTGPPVLGPKPPPTPAAPKPAEEDADDYLAKLRKAKKRAPHERDREDI